MLTGSSARRTAPLSLLLLIGILLCNAKLAHAQAIDEICTGSSWENSSGGYYSSFERLHESRYYDEFAGELWDEVELPLADFEEGEPPSTFISSVLNGVAPSVATYRSIDAEAASRQLKKALRWGGIRPLTPSRPPREARGGHAPAQPDSGSDHTLKRGALPLYGWPRSRVPLRVYFAGDLDEARQGKLVRWYVDCMNQWCRATEGRISYNVTYDFRYADIVVARDLPNNCRLAENIPDFHDAWLDKVTIKLHDDTCDKLCEPVVRAILLHEIGHSLGVFDHSSERHSAMYENSSDPASPARALTAKDRAGVKDMYESYWK